MNALHQTHPTLMPLIDDAVEAIDALKKQTIEFYRDAYSKWWARVPAPPETPTQLVPRALSHRSPWLI